MTPTSVSPLPGRQSAVGPYGSAKKEPEKLATLHWSWGYTQPINETAKPATKTHVLRYHLLAPVASPMASWQWLESKVWSARDGSPKVALIVEASNFKNQSMMLVENPVTCFDVFVELSLCKGKKTNTNWSCWEKTKQQKSSKLIGTYFISRI